MTSEEKSAWVMLVVAACAYGVYVAVILAGAARSPLAEVPYAAAMLWTIGGAIVANIVLNTLAGIGSPKSAAKKDQRDREIYHFGEYVGGAFVVIGGVATLIMAMLELPYFWIANVVYLTFVLSAILSSVAKVVVYRRGLPAW
jgi:hypothetical protein